MSEAAAIPLISPQVVPEITQYSYYPGCSLHATSIEYHLSVEAVFKVFGIDLYELEDWNCCSAASGNSIDHALSIALPARNLAIAQKAGRELVIPCSGCFSRHKAAEFELLNNPKIRSLVEKAVDFQYTGTIKIRSILDVLGSSYALEKIKSKVVRPLRGLKVAAYYGCLVVRPQKVTQLESPENPVLLPNILKALGAEVRPWSYATDCCGGDLGIVKAKTTSRLVDHLVDHAREAGAEALVTCCPLCQTNLEMRQSDPGNKMPMFFITELMGLAFGLKESESWWGKHIIDPNGLLKKAELL
jgi:heterodisulfide reductase subunit B2